MGKNFTQGFKEIVISITFIFLTTSTALNAQSCGAPTGLNVTNLSNYSATANWNYVSGVDNYRLRYKIVGATSWSFRNGISGDSTNCNLQSLVSDTSYIWQLKAYCTIVPLNASSWSVSDTFLTANYPVDCNNTPNGTAFIDSCGNCVGGTTNKTECIAFSPTVSISLASYGCNDTTSMTFSTSQDPNEPDISSAVFSSNSGYFNLIGLNTNDTIGSSSMIAGGGYMNINTTLLVDFILTPDRISVKAIDNITGVLYGSFTIENTIAGGILIVSTSPPDNNNVTNGNSQSTVLNNLFVNPSPTTLNFSSNIISELGNVDNQTVSVTIACTDCNNDFGGTAFVDSCGNCVGGLTGNLPCIAFSPSVSVSLSNTDCDSLTDLTISVSQDPNEPDMSTALFASDGGEFAISTMSVGDTVGSAIMSANAGAINFNTNLVVTSIISINQAIIQSKDIITGLVLGTFTISNSNPGINIIAQSPPDNNNVTSGNSQTVTFTNVFVNPGQSTLTFTTTINSELGDVDVQSFPFSIVCLCVPNTSTTTTSGCDSYTWNGVTYTSSGTYTFLTTNVGGCDSTATLILTIDNSTSASMSATACDSYTWSVDGNTYTASGTYTSVSTNAAGCTHVDSLILTIDNSTSASMSATACDTYTWSGTTYTASGTYTYSTTNANGCDSTATLNLTINPSTTSSVSVTECDTYTWNGTTYTASGTYTSVSTNAAGCTHVDSLVLTINNSTTSLTTITATNTYTWNGITYISSGVYTYSATNSIGCDSTATLNLTIIICTVPTNLATTPLLDRAIMSWDAVAGVDHYEIRFKALAASSWIVMTPLYGTSQTKYSLTVSTAYQWQIRTLCNASSTSSSAWSDTVNFFTLTPCPSPTGMDEIIINLNSATLTLDSVSGAFGYEFRIKKTTDPWGGWNYLTSSTNTLNAVGLDNSTDYHWQVRIICNAGGVNNSNFSAYNYFTTLTPCADPSSLTIDSTGIYSATLSWTGVGADHYQIRYRENGLTAWDTTSTTNTSITLSGLNSLTTHNWEVIAFCEADGRNNSDTIAGPDFTTQNPCTTPNGLGISLALLNKLTFTWNAQAPAHHYDLRLRAVGDTVWLVLTPIYANSITKSNLTPGTAYEWQVQTVCDAAGNSSSDWSVLKVSSTLSPCSAPTNPTASAIHLTTATLNWDASPGAYQYDVRFKEVGSSWGSWVYTSTTDLFLVQTGLNPNTSYQWQVRTNCDVNGNNYSAWVTNQVVTTTSFCSTPSSLQVISTNLTSANVTINGSSSINYYSVIHKELGTSNWDTTIIVSGLINSGYALLTFSGLQAGTTYEWQVSAACLADGSNSSAYTAGPNFTTEALCPIPTNLISSVSGNSVILNWDAVSGADHYTLRYRISGDTIWNTFGNITATTFTRNGLDFNTQYEWQVSSSCNSTSYNSSPFSASTTFVTAGCIVPTNLYSDLIGTDRATMNWDATATAHHYDIRMREAGTSGWAVNITFIYATSQTKHSLTDGTNYEWQLRAVCTFDTSSVSNWSATQSFTTLANCTQKPINLNTTNITLTSATLNWDASANAIGYIVRHKEMAGSWGSWVYDTVYTNSLAKTGLTPGTAYDWRALSFCDSNMTNISGWNNATYITSNLCTAPTNLGVDFTTLDAATLFWDFDPLAISYTLFYRVSGIANWDTASIALGDITVYSNISYYTLNGLSNSNTYEWEISANCSQVFSNSSPATAGINFSTLTPCTLPVNMATSNIDVFTATLNWSAVSGVDHYEVRYALDGSSNWSSVVVAGTDSSVNIGGLVSDTAYQWQIMVACEAGGINNTIWSSSALFSTAVCDVPSNLSTSNILTDRATMNWLANAHHYNIRFRVQGSSIWLYYYFIYGNSQTKHSLNPGITYEWEIQSMCAQTMVASPPWSATQTFTTLEDCSLAPSMTITTNITLTSADISWNTTTYSLGYIVRFKEQAGAWGSWVYDTVSATTISKTGLTAITGYHWQVRAYCNVELTNLSQWTTDESFYTLTPCSNPTSVGVSNNSISITEATLDWKGTSGADHYELNFRVVGDTIWNSLSISGNVVTPITALPAGMSATATSNGPHNHLELTGLTGGTVYEWEIMTACSPGGINNSAFVSGNNFTTDDACTLPINLHTTNIFTNKATMNWTPTSSSIHHYKIQMRVAGSNNWNITINNIGGNSQTKHSLNPGTIYEWQIAATCSPGNNANNFTAWSTSDFFTTLVNCDTKPSNTASTNITLTTADISWDAVSGAQAYEVRLKESGGGWSTWIYTTYTQTSVTRTGLTTSTQYSWQVRSVCDTLNSITTSWTQKKDFITLTPCPDPFSLSVGAYSLTYNTATLYWSGVYGADGYLLNYRVAGTSTWTTVSISNTNSGSFILTGLSPNTTYEWQISTTCLTGVNSSSFVSGPNFTTALACIIPTGMNTTNILLDRATMTWTATSNAHHYDVRLRSSGGSWIDLFFITSNAITKFNLLSGTTYEWKVRGVCTTDSSDASAWTVLQTFTTLSPCTKPTNTNVTAITASGATLGWDVVGAATSYDVRFKLTTASWSSWEYTFGVIPNQLLQDSLNVGTSYHWQVRAVCGSTANMSGFTSYNTFSTLSSVRISAGDSKLADNLTIYPNPTRGVFTISFISEEIDNLEITIVDAFGKLISKEAKQAFVGEYNKQLDFSNYPRGIYMVQIRTNDSFVSKRVVVQ